MGERESRFELLCRGEVVETFVGPRSTAKAEAEEKLKSYKMSDLAFIREAATGLGAVPTPVRSSRIKPFNIILVIIFGFFWFWIEFF